MSRALASCAARLLQRAATQCSAAGSLATAAAAVTQPVCSFPTRSFAAAAAQGGKRLQPVVSQLQGAAATRAAAAAGGTGLAVAAAAVRQQSRGFARYLQFQPRQVRRWDANPDHVLYGLMGLNVAGWLAWQVWPRQVGAWAGCLLLVPARSCCCCGMSVRCSKPDHVRSYCSCRHCIGLHNILVSFGFASCTAFAAPLPQMNKHAVVSIESLQSGRLWTAVTAAFRWAAARSVV